jgi:hypothetical protein
MGWNFDPISRYDERRNTKFDVDVRDRPSLPRVDTYCSRHHLDNITANTAEGIAVAYEMLIARDLAAVLLGSAMRDVANPAIHDQFPKHRDLDILILNTHSPQNPAPNEAGIDWFVRPKGQRPTNGRSELWYDLEVASGVRIRGRGQQPSYVLTEDGTGIEENNAPNDRLALVNRPKTQGSTAIPAGLYIPDGQIAEMIRHHCQAKIDHVREVHAKAADRLKNLAEEVTATLRRETADMTISNYELTDHQQSVVRNIIGECMRSTAAALRTIGVETELEGWSSCQFERFFVERMGRETILQWISRKLYGIFQCNTKDVSGYPISATRFDHLSLQGIDFSRSALPVLPHKLVRFTGY